MAKTRTRDETDDSPKRPQPVARDGPYVMMLFVTLVALIAGCVLLYLDNEEYGGKSPPATPKLEIQKLGDAAKIETPATPPGGPGPGPAPPPPGPGPGPEPMPGMP